METIPYDSAAGFTDPAAQAELLADAIAEGDAAYLAHALGIIARARGMVEVQRATGLNRQALYRGLSADGNPTLDTVLKVVKALGLKLTIEPRVDPLAA
jgi:probable addiction module antidote protein